MSTGAVQSFGSLHAVSLERLGSVSLLLLSHVRVHDLLPSSMATLPESGAVGIRLGRRWVWGMWMRSMRVRMVFAFESISFLGARSL